jgi:hypothetical protein
MSCQLKLLQQLAEQPLFKAASESFRALMMNIVKAKLNQFVAAGLSACMYPFAAISAIVLVTVCLHVVSQCRLCGDVLSQIFQ